MDNDNGDLDAHRSILPASLLVAFLVLIALWCWTQQVTT
jgi:hypothetical protein